MEYFSSKGMAFSLDIQFNYILKDICKKSFLKKVKSAILFVWILSLMSKRKQQINKIKINLKIS
jgi:hypothetical protein